MRSKQEIKDRCLDLREQKREIEDYIEEAVVKLAKINKAIEELTWVLDDGSTD